MAALTTLPLAAQPNAKPVSGDHRIVQGKVNCGTYTGWQLFHATCYGCHGVGAVDVPWEPIWRRTWWSV